MKFRLITQFILFFLFGATLVCGVDAAGILPSGSETIKNDSITVDISGNKNDPIEASRSLGIRILSAAKVVVSGFALLYIVMIGVYMIVFSDNEDRIKSQRKQIVYVLVGFLFLNIPGTLYDIFFTGAKDTIGDGTPNLSFWNTDRLTGGSGVVPMITGFFEVFIFGVAIASFTYGLLRMIMSGWDEERQKAAKNKILYGTLGLIFLGFVRVWSSVIARGDFQGEVATVWRKLLWLALYFAGPVAIFFIVLAAYYYMTSAWEEDRIKKAKSILVNTLIASIILLAAYSFFSDIVTFSGSF